MAERLGYRPVDNAEQWASEIDPSTEDPAESKNGLQGRNSQILWIADPA
jgi:hypothetical protein